MYAYAFNAGFTFKETVFDELEVPEHVKPKLNEPDSITTIDSFPEVPLSPDHAPFAVQELALEDDHVSVTSVPVTTVEEDMLKLMTGAGLEGADAEPPPPPPQLARINVKVKIITFSLFI
tara:strand:+ start:962 stop:1321 length:360 start_codon:yes stop_codon:yes gene_type:complete